MFELFLLAKVIHIISATILFGTGIGIAFFFLFGMRAGFNDGNGVAALFAARTTAVADMVFTLNAGIVQPASGFFLVYLAGHDPFAPWLVATYVLYLVALTCWVPVVRLQLKIRDAWQSKTDGEAVDEALLRRRFRWWFALGWPAFGALTIIFWLMVAKPA